MAQVRLPPEIDASVRLADVPGGNDLPLISAVAYAMLIAGKTGRSLRITGDRSVWPGEWGGLLEVASAG